jgi:hypothetical protein
MNEDILNLINLCMKLIAGAEFLNTELAIIRLNDLEILEDYIKEIT